MRIIGVIDIRNGQSVHARGGRRAEYKPVTDAAGVPVDGAPLSLARVYRDTFGLEEIYIADLDAIASLKANDDTIAAIGELEVSVMVDAGVATPQAAARTSRAGAATVVVGLETLQSFDALADICRIVSGDVAFSLDLREGTPIGGFTGHSPESLAEQAVAAGASEVIVLDLARVGASAGPDLAMLTRVRRAVPQRAVLAGGGVRNLDDLRILAGIGCAGALVASALHDGRLSGSEMEVARLL